MNCNRFYFNVLFAYHIEGLSYPGSNAYFLDDRLLLFAENDTPFHDDTDVRNLLYEIDWLWAGRKGGNLMS